MKTSKIAIRSLLVLLIPLICFLAAACFSPWQGDEAMLTLNLGRTASRALTGQIPDMVNEIYLEGPGGNQTIRAGMDETSVQVSIVPGRWDITIRSYFNYGDHERELRYKGSARVQLKPGKNEPITVKMYPVLPDTGVYITITFEQITDETPVTIEPVIYLPNVSGKPTTATLKAADPDQYERIEWYINGVTGSGPSFTLDTNNPAYNRLGFHFLTVEVWKYGIPYSQTIRFEVAD